MKAMGYVWRRLHALGKCKHVEDRRFGLRIIDPYDHGEYDGTPEYRLPLVGSPEC